MNKTKIEWADYRIGDHRVLTKEGYALVYCPGHPHAKSKGHVYEHRYVMEKHFGRFLSPDEQVHHIDGNKANNEIGNLALSSASDHARHHNRKNPEKSKQGTAALIRQAKERKIPRIEIPCACGCGRSLTTPDQKGRARKYIHGHNQFGKTWRQNHAKNED